jgi:hypothetical protein
MRTFAPFKGTASAGAATGTEAGAETLLRRAVAGNKGFATIPATVADGVRA